METGRIGRWAVVSLLAVLISFSFFSFSADAAIPHTISYQGYLTNASGVPVDGTITMVFTIFDVPSGGSPIWGETQLNVPVINGIYNVILGSVNVINLTFNAQYYLGINIGGEELSPRKAITSVGYAFRAYTVDIVPSHSHMGADITGGTVAEARIDNAIARTSALAPLTAHTINTNNPHGTTAAQVQAAPAVHDHAGVYVGVGQASSVTSAMITDGAVAAADLASSSVTKPKLSAAGGTAGQVLATDGSNLVWQASSTGVGWVDDGGYVRLATATDKVGIGIATPEQNLEIKSAGSAYVGIDRGTDQLGGISHKEAGVTKWIFPFFRGWQSDNLIVRDEANVKDTMVFEAGSGNVGIGVNPPTVKLDVNGQIQARNGYGETISLGGDAVGGDFEITISSPSHNFVSLWNASTASPANLGAGRVDVSERVTKTYSGATFGITPIAYGIISWNVLQTQIFTNNFTVTRNCTENRYEISIAGEDLVVGNHVVVANFDFPDNAVRVVSTSTVDGNLLFYVRDIWGNRQQICGLLQDDHQFHFVVFKP